MTSDKHVYLIDTSYVEAMRRRFCRYLRSNASHEIALNSVRRTTIATKRTRSAAEINSAIAGTFSKHCLMAADWQHIVRPSSIPLDLAALSEC